MDNPLTWSHPRWPTFVPQVDIRRLFDGWLAPAGNLPRNFRGVQSQLTYHNNYDRVQHESNLSSW